MAKLVSHLSSLLNNPKQRKRSLTHKTFQNLHPPTNVAKNVATINTYTQKRKRNFRGKPRLKAMKNAFLPVAFH